MRFQCIFILEQRRHWDTAIGKEFRASLAIANEGLATIRGRQIETDNNN